MWILRTTDNQTNRVLRLTPGSPRTIGRASLADFPVKAALISRLHCRLVPTQTGLRVEDLKSTNGTFVNGKRVSEAPLQVGDRLRLGRLELEVSRQ